MASPSDKALEDRAFELLEHHTSSEIAAELGLGERETAEILYKVVKERSTPNLVAAREARLRAMEAMRRI